MEGGSWRKFANGQPYEHVIASQLRPTFESSQRIQKPSIEKSDRLKHIEQTLSTLNLHYFEFAPWNPQEHPNTPERWQAVLEAVTTLLTCDDAWSTDDTTRRFLQKICYAVLQEKPYWNSDVRLNGRFLTLLDSTIIAARLHDEYYDSNLRNYVDQEFGVRWDDPDAGFAIESQIHNPLLRRKTEAMHARHEISLPKNPQELKELYKQFSLVTQFDASEIDAMPDDALLKINPYITGDEGVTEYLWTQKIRALEAPSLRKGSDDVNLIITQIAPGKVGAFDAMGRLIGVRNTQDSTIIPIADDTDLSHKDIADDIAFAFDIGMREQFSKDFGFPIEHLTLREQISLIGTLRSITSAEEQRIVSTVNHFGIDGARAFLSTEFGDEFRGTVLSIAEKFPEDDAKQIFKSFSEIVTFAQETAETLGRRFFANDKTYNADAVRTELLSRAKDLLLTAESSDASSIAAKLERFKADIVLFASMFKVTQKGHEVKFEDIKDVRLESLSSNELTQADKTAMTKILTENWSKQAPELLESTRKSLQDSFTNPRSQFFILRKGNGIAASVRFDEQDNGSLYAGSLNVNDVYRSAGIGEAMLQSTIDTLAKNHVITAHVPAHLPVAMKYVNDFGLKIVGIDKEVQSDGTIVRDLKLERDDEKNRHYGAHPHIERFDLSRGDGEIVAEVQRQTEHGQVATKYFSDPLNPHLRFIAFEPAVTVTQDRQAA